MYITIHVDKARFSFPEHSGKKKEKKNTEIRINYRSKRQPHLPPHFPMRPKLIILHLATLYICYVMTKIPAGNSSVSI